MTVEFYDTPLAAPVEMPNGTAARSRVDVRDAVFLESRRLADRLALPGAVAVTTGQQPGLFTGPLYGIHKALSARALARELERSWGRPVVPVFWVAGDDHDFAEASTAAWLAADGTVMTGSLPPRAAGAALTPLYREPVTETATAVLRQLIDSVSPGELRDETEAWLTHHYRPEATLAQAYGGALAEALGSHGIVCVDGSAASVKQRAWSVMRQALVQARLLDQLLLERSTELTSTGRDPGVKVGDGATLVMLEATGGRDRLLSDGDAFLTRRSRERFTLDELDRIAATEPTRLSPNVLLRPVVEAHVLPTVAYLAGPGELRYLDLAQVLYEPLGVTPQRPTPRWSGLLIERRVARTLEKLGITVSEVSGDAKPLEDRLARGAIPDGFTSVLAALRDEIEQRYERLAEEIRAIDPTFEKPARSAKGNALAGLSDLERRVLQAAKKKQSDSMSQLERARAALNPLGQPQERVLCLPGFTARYGKVLLEDLAGHVDRWYARALEAPAASL